MGYSSIPPQRLLTLIFVLGNIVSIFSIPPTGITYSDCQLLQCHTMCGVPCRFAFQEVYAPSCSTGPSRLYVLIDPSSRVVNFQCFWYSGSMSFQVLHCLAEDHVNYTTISRPPYPKIPCPSRRRSDRHPTKPTLSIAKLALCSSIAAFSYLQPTKCQGSARRPRHHTTRTRQTARLKIRNCQGQSEYRFLVVWLQIRTL